MSKKQLFAGSLAVISVLASAIFAATRNFVPDVTFKGSALTGWHKLGQADWRANNGEIFGTPKSESGGWLVLDRGFQDIQFFASFRCTGACKAGVLLRAEKTADGMKGVYVSLTEGDVAPYNLVLDAQGNEISRSKLDPAPGPMIRMASARFSGSEDLVPGFSRPSKTPAEMAAAQAPANSAAPGGRGRGGSGPQPHAGDWNTVQIILDADVLSLSVNQG